MRMTRSSKDSQAALEEAIDRYNDAWNAHDLDAIVALHAPDMVFENHTAGEVAEGEAVLRLDGEDHPAPAGTFASIEPAADRTILNRSDSTVTAMLIGVQPDGGYEPMSWA